MIANSAEPSKNKTALDLIRESEHQFFLTGSRYFGGYNKDSDHDFFAQDSHTLRGWLEDNQFTEDHPASYNDKSCVAIYAHAYESVHIQLVNDVGLKADAQNLLYLYAQMHLVDKKARRQLWNLALAWAVERSVVD